MIRKISHAKIVIIGASKGLGAALARELDQRENSLILVSRNAEKLSELASGLKSAHCYSCDISSPEETDKVMKQIVDEHNDISHIFLNAAICEEGEVDDKGGFVKHIETNLLGTVRCIQSFYPLFAERNRGTFIVINTMVALAPIPLYQSYSCSKAALRSFVRSVRIRNDNKNIKWISVYPGFIETEMIAKASHPKPLQLTPSEMAKKICRRIEWGFNEIHIPALFGWVMLFGNAVPDILYRRLFKRRYFGRYFDVDKYHR